MPHLRIDYTGNLGPYAGMDDLCQALASAMAALSDGGKPVFPLPGTRVLAYPAPFHSVADGHAGNAFVYLNLRITPGRTPAVITSAGDALLAVAREHFDRLELGVPIGITLHIDEMAPSYEGRHRP